MTTNAFDFLKAKSAHLNWRVRILSFLNGEGTLTKEQVISHEHCDLGKWIYSEGLQKYGNLSEMTELEKTHKHLHNSMAKILDLKENNLLKEARDEYENMREVSEILIKMLDILYEIQKK
jgi:methyl-accepting chemotaxis protein